MREARKLLFIIMPVLILVLAILGMWMIHISFLDALERKIEECRSESKYAATTYVLTGRAYEEAAPGRFTVDEVVGAFHEREKESEGCLRIYDESGRVLYEDNSLTVKHGIWEKMKASDSFGYEVCRSQGEYYIVAISYVQNAEYIEIIRQISDVFLHRQVLIENLKTGLVVTSLAVGIILWMAIYLSLVREEALRKERFTFAFAHELKTPLTSIIGYSEMLATMDLSAEEIHLCGDYINRQSKRLKSLSYKLLEMAFLRERGIEKKRIEVRVLAALVEETEKPLAEEKGMVWHMEMEDEEIFGDLELLQSLFINLLDNAMKASNQGGTIWFLGKAERNGFTFTVADEGKGVAKEALYRLTEAFYMEDKSRSRSAGGAGLGLTLCSRIAELHGTKLEFESEEGKGMRVCVRFPIKK